MSVKGTMQFQIFAKAMPSLGLDRKFNPYLSVGRFEIAIDSDGFLLSYGRRCCGWIKGAGFHRGFSHD